MGAMWSSLGLVAAGLFELSGVRRPQAIGDPPTSRSTSGLQADERRDDQADGRAQGECARRPLLRNESAVREGSARKGAGGAQGRALVHSLSDGAAGEASNRCRERLATARANEMQATTRPIVFVAAREKEGRGAERAASAALNSRVPAATVSHPNLRKRQQRPRNESTSSGNSSSSSNNNNSNNNNNNTNNDNKPAAPGTISSRCGGGAELGRSFGGDGGKLKQRAELTDDGEPDKRLWRPVCGGGASYNNLTTSTPARARDEGDNKRDQGRDWGRDGDHDQDRGERVFAPSGHGRSIGERRWQSSASVGGGGGSFDGAYCVNGSSADAPSGAADEWAGLASGRAAAWPAARLPPRPQPCLSASPSARTTNCKLERAAADKSGTSRQQQHTRDTNNKLIQRSGPPRAAARASRELAQTGAASNDVDVWSSATTYHPNRTCPILMPRGATQQATVQQAAEAKLLGPQNKLDVNNNNSKLIRAAANSIQLDQRPLDQVPVKTAASLFAQHSLGSLDNLPCAPSSQIKTNAEMAAQVLGPANLTTSQHHCKPPPPIASNAAEQRRQFLMNGRQASLTREPPVIMEFSRQRQKQAKQSKLVPLRQPKMSEVVANLGRSSGYLKLNSLAAGSNSINQKQRPPEPTTVKLASLLAANPPAASKRCEPVETIASFTALRRLASAGHQAKRKLLAFDHSLGQLEPLYQAESSEGQFNCHDDQQQQHRPCNPLLPSPASNFTSQQKISNSPPNQRNKRLEKSQSARVADAEDDDGDISTTSANRFQRRSLSTCSTLTTSSANSLGSASSHSSSQLGSTSSLAAPCSSASSSSSSSGFSSPAPANDENISTPMERAAPVKSRRQLRRQQQLSHTGADLGAASSPDPVASPAVKAARHRLVYRRLAGRQLSSESSCSLSSDLSSSSPDSVSLASGAKPGMDDSQASLHPSVSALLHSTVNLSVQQRRTALVSTEAAQKRQKRTTKNRMVVAGPQHCIQDASYLAEPTAAPVPSEGLVSAQKLGGACQPPPRPWLEPHGRLIKRSSCQLERAASRSTSPILPRHHSIGDVPTSKPTAANDNVEGPRQAENSTAGQQQELDKVEQQDGQVKSADSQAEQHLQRPPPSPPPPWNEFTALSYNVLSDRLVKPDRYPSSPDIALNWLYRRELILRQLDEYDADLVGLQELEMEQFSDYFEPKLRQLADYVGLFESKSRARTMDAQMRKRVDGCAIFFKRKRFKLVANHLLEFNQLALANARGSEDMINRVSTRDNIAMVAVLELIGSPDTPLAAPLAAAGDSGAAAEVPQRRGPRRLIVCNTHIHWDPEYCDVKLIQTIMLMNELKSIASHYQQLADKENDDEPGERAEIPLVLLGDFNSLPNSGVTSYLLSGRISGSHKDFKQFKYTTCSNTLARAPPTEATPAPALAQREPQPATLRQPAGGAALVLSRAASSVTSGAEPARDLRRQSSAPSSQGDDPPCLSPATASAAGATTTMKVMTQTKDEKQPIDYEHPFKLKSAYEPGSMPFTNYTTKFKATIDYIFYSHNSLALLGLLGPLDKRWLRGNKIRGFPQLHFPSDHLPLLVKFKLLDRPAASTHTNPTAACALDEQPTTPAAQLARNNMTTAKLKERERSSILPRQNQHQQTREEQKQNKKQKHRVKSGPRAQQRASVSPPASCCRGLAPLDQPQPLAHLALHCGLVGEAQ